MISIKSHLDIQRPVDDVFNFVVNVENAPKWQPAVIETKRMTAGPLRVGSQFQEIAKMMGRRVTTVCEITELVPGRRLAFSATSNGPMSYATSYTFHEAGDITRLTIEGTFALQGFWRLLEPLVKGEVRKESVQELMAMKSAIEAQ